MTRCVGVLFMHHPSLSAFTLEDEDLIASFHLFQDIAGHIDLERNFAHRPPRNLE